jgi:hypothetical protein
MLISLKENALDLVTRAKLAQRLSRLLFRPVFLKVIVINLS